MAGGWRYGAGRPGWKRSTGDTLQVDVRRLHREGHLAVRCSLSWQWSNGASIRLHTSPDAVTLDYRYRVGGDDWREVLQPVGIVRTPCHYGGERPWFACPRCGRRVAILYLSGPPACRTCKRMAYPVQSADAIDRSWRRTRKLARRLGSDDWDTLPRRPKGMHWATYERLCAELLAEAELRNELMGAFLLRFGRYL